MTWDAMTSVNQLHKTQPDAALQNSVCCATQFTHRKNIDRIPHTTSNQKPNKQQKSASPLASGAM